MANFMPTDEELMSDRERYEQAKEAAVLDPIGARDEKASPYKRALDTAGSFVHNTANEVLLGTLPVFEGAFYGTGKLLKGEEDPYSTAYKESQEQLALDRERIGTVGQIGSGVVGGFAPGPAKMLDEAVDASRSLSRKVAPHAWDKMKRFGTAMGLGGATNSFMSYMEGDKSWEQIVADGTLGAVTSGLMQRIVGDGQYPIADKIHGRMWGGDASAEVLRSIEDTGMGAPKGFNINTLARMVDEGIEPGQGLLNTQIGNAPVARQWGRFNDYLAEKAFPAVDPKKTNLHDYQLGMQYYEDVNHTVQRFHREVNEKMNGIFDSVVPANTTRKASLFDNDRTLRAVGKKIKELESTVPLPDGTLPVAAQPFNPREFVEQIAVDLPKIDDRTTLLESKSPTMGAYNYFKDLIRGMEVETVAKGAGNIQSRGKHMPRADEIFPEELPLSRLMDARQQLAQSTKPSMAFDQGISPQDVRARVKLLGMVDDKLDALTEGRAGMLRGEYAKYKRIEGLYDLGRSFYDNRTHVSMDKDRNFKEWYGESTKEIIEELKGDPMAMDAFTTGFKSGLGEGVERHTFMNEMHNLIGEYSSTMPDGGFFDTKRTNLKTLKTLLGREDSEKLLSLYEQGAATSKNTDALVKALDAKTGQVHNAKTPLVELASETIPQQGGTPQFIADNVYPVLRKITPSGDRNKVDAALRLMTQTGPELEQTLTDAAESYVGGFARQVGTRGGLASPGTEAFGVDAEELADETRAWLEGKESPKSKKAKAELLKELERTRGTD